MLGKKQEKIVTTKKGIDKEDRATVNIIKPTIDFTFILHLQPTDQC